MLQANMSGEDFSPPPNTLCVNQIVIHYFHCPIPDIVYPLHPPHLILRFELFCHALPFCHLLCQQEHPFRCLFVDVGKVCIQPAAGQQFRVKSFSLLFDVPQVPLSPYPDGFFSSAGTVKQG